MPLTDRSSASPAMRPLGPVRLWSPVAIAVGLVLGGCGGSFALMAFNSWRVGARARALVLGLVGLGLWLAFFLTRSARLGLSENLWGQLLLVAGPYLPILFYVYQQSGRDLDQWQAQGWRIDRAPWATGLVLAVVVGLLLDLCGTTW